MEQTIAEGLKFHFNTTSFLCIFIGTVQPKTNWSEMKDQTKRRLMLLTVCKHLFQYSTGRSQHNTDFANMNQNEVVRIRMNFFEDFRIRKLICENEFVILNL